MWGTNPCVQYVYRQSVFVVHTGRRPEAPRQRQALALKAQGNSSPQPAAGIVVRGYSCASFQPRSWAARRQLQLSSSTTHAPCPHARAVVPAASQGTIELYRLHLSTLKCPRGGSGMASASRRNLRRHPGDSCADPLHGSTATQECSSSLKCEIINSACSEVDVRARRGVMVHKRSTDVYWQVIG